MSTQNYTSAGTSINSSHAPALFTKGIIPPVSWLTVFDYGCGKYPGIISNAIKNGYYGYDKFNQSEETNKEFFKALKQTSRNSRVFTCCNVLNVIDDDSVVQEIINFATKNFNHCYFQIYEGNKSGIGKPTKNNTCYQRNAKTADYLNKFNFNSKKFNIRICNGNIIHCYAKTA